MISIQQALQGVSKYIDTEMLPHMTGAKKVGVGIYTALVLQNAAGAVEKFKTHPAIAMLNVIDSNNMLDVDALYKAAFPLFAEKQRVNVPIIGELVFDQSDVEKLYRYMKGGA